MVPSETSSGISTPPFSSEPLHILRPLHPLQTLLHPSLSKHDALDHVPPFNTPLGVRVWGGTAQYADDGSQRDDFWDLDPRVLHYLFSGVGLVWVASRVILSERTHEASLNLRWTPHNLASLCALRAQRPAVGGVPSVWCSSIYLGIFSTPAYPTIWFRVWGKVT